MRGSVKGPISPFEETSEAGRLQASALQSQAFRQLLDTCITLVRIIRQSLKTRIILVGTIQKILKNLSSP